MCGVGGGGIASRTFSPPKQGCRENYIIQNDTPRNVCESYILQNDTPRIVFSLVTGQHIRGSANMEGRPGFTVRIRNSGGRRTEVGVQQNTPFLGYEAEPGPAFTSLAVGVCCAEWDCGGRKWDSCDGYAFA